MSLENKIEKLTEAVVSLTAAMAGSKVEAPAKVEEPKANKPKSNKPKANKVLKAQVDAKAAEIMAECGKDKLTELLSNFGAKKMSDLKAGAGVFEDFVARADVLLKEKKPEVVEATVEQTANVLDDSPKEEEEEEVAVTLEDVKKSVMKVMDHADLGQNFALAIVSEFKAERIGDLEAKDYAKVITRCDEEIAKVSK